MTWWNGIVEIKWNVLTVWIIMFLPAQCGLGFFTGLWTLKKPASNVLSSVATAVVFLIPALKAANLDFTAGFLITGLVVVFFWNKENNIL